VKSTLPPENSALVKSILLPQNLELRPAAL
jgi:hypothetical protein